MPRYWSLCDLALVHLKDAQLFETVIPSKLFEAMGMGLPILLVAPKGEASRLVLKEGVGVHLPAGNADDFALSLALMMSAQGTIDGMAGRSRAAAPNYSRAIQARLYITSLEQACRPVLASNKGLAPSQQHS
jgi:colanic acid biosynthesis glycosyl transferase WcaI